MTSFDSPKAQISAMAENLRSIDKQPRVGEPCPRCGRPFENVMPMDREPLILCPPCERDITEAEAARNFGDDE